MKLKFRQTLLAATALTIGILGACSTSHAVELWMTQLGGNVDYAERWTLGDSSRLTQWPTVRANLKVLKLYVGQIDAALPTDLARLATVCAQNDIKISVEISGIANAPAVDTNRLSECGERSAGIGMTTLNKYIAQGGSVDFLSFDDPYRRIFYPSVNGVGVETEYYTNTEATREIVDMMLTYRESLPNVQFIYLTNFPNWGWGAGAAYYNLGFSAGVQGRGNLRPLLASLHTLANAEGVRLYGIECDHPYTYFLGTHSTNQPVNVISSVNWPARVRALESFAETRALKFILIANHEEGGLSGNSAFRTGCLNYVRDYKSGGGSPFAYMIQSWYPYPTTTLSETTTATLTEIARSAISRF